MSVPTYRRKESTSQFIQTAQQLVRYTLQKSLKLPKRYTFFITTDLVKTSQEIYKNVLKMQVLYSPTEEHKKRKVELCEECLGLLSYLESQLDLVIAYTKEITENAFDKWVELIETEKRLLKGLIDKNK